MKKMILYVMIAVIIFTLSCDKTPKISTIKIGYTDYNFDQSIVMVIKGILDQQPNVEVELYRLPDSTMFRVLSENEIDIAISGWLPNTHGGYEDMYASTIQPYSTLCDSLGLYMVVTGTSELSSIDDLLTAGALINHTIVIPESQNAIYHLAKDILTDYGFSRFQLLESSWDNIITMLDDSAKNNTNFAFIGLRPHWIFQRYQIKTLADTKEALGRYEKAFLFVNRDFPDRQPLYASFFSKMHFTLRDLEVIMELNQRLGSEPYENALRWINDNENISKINEWLTE